MGSKPIDISASRGAALLGVSPYTTPLQAWCEIMEERKPGFCAANGFLTPERKDPFAKPYDPKLASLRWGTIFEDAICRLVNITWDREQLYNNPFHPYITCHIDGREESGRLNENKTAFDMAFRSAWGEPGSDMIPKQYQVQVQHQMICTGEEICRVNCLVFPKAPAEFEKEGIVLPVDSHGNITRRGDFSGTLYDWVDHLNSLGYFHHYYIESNADTQKAMVERYQYIWEENILKEVPPPAKGYSDIKWTFPSPEGEVEADQTICELWQEYNDCDHEIKSMTDRMSEIKNTFSEYADNCKRENKIRATNIPGKLNFYAGNRKLFSITKPLPRTAVSRSSAERIKADYPDLYEEMKKISLADIINISFTDKQEEELKELEKQEMKFLKKKKLTSLLDKSSIISILRKSKPEIYNMLLECSIIEDIEPVARMTICKVSEDLND